MNISTGFTPNGDKDIGFSQPLKSILLGLALVLINISLVFLASKTPLRVVNEYLFSIFIIGVIVYGLLISLGEYISRRGIKRNNLIHSLIGVMILQFTYAMFGAGILSYVPTVLSQVKVLGITGAITGVIVAVVSTYVHVRNDTFDNWRTYSGFSFVAVLIFSAIYTVVSVNVILYLAFALALVGFVFELGYQIWASMAHSEEPLYHAIGVYVATMGIFVHVLQLVAEQNID